MKHLSTVLIFIPMQKQRKIIFRTHCENLTVPIVRKELEYRLMTNRYNIHIVRFGMLITRL